MTTEQTVKGGAFSINCGGGTIVYYKVVDAKTIEIYTDAHIVEKTENNQLIEISTGNFTLKIGDEFDQKLSTIPSKYLIKYITKFEGKGYNYFYSLATHLENRTTDYILPCLGITREDLGYDKKLGYNPYLVNAYLTKEKDKLALLYRFSTHEKYGIIESSLIRSKQFVELDNGYKGFDLVIMKILPKFEKDIDLFKMGSYSKLSKELKDSMVKFHGLKEKDNLWQIIFKGEALIKKIQKEFGMTTEIAELESKPNLQLEIIQNVP